MENGSTVVHNGICLEETWLCVVHPIFSTVFNTKYMCAIFHYAVAQCLLTFSRGAAGKIRLNSPVLLLSGWFFCPLMCTNKQIDWPEDRQFIPLWLRTNDTRQLDLAVFVCNRARFLMICNNAKIFLHHFASNRRLMTAAVICQWGNLRLFASKTLLQRAMGREELYRESLPAMVYLPLYIPFHSIKCLALLHYLHCQRKVLQYTVHVLEGVAAPVLKEQVLANANRYFLR